MVDAEKEQQKQHFQKRTKETKTSGLHARCKEQEEGDFSHQVFQNSLSLYLCICFCFFSSFPMNGVVVCRR
jgi:hypothetical protein